MLRGVCYGLLAGAMWGTIFLVPRWLGGFSPLALACGRYLAYGLLSLLLLAPSWRSLAPRVRRCDWLALVRLSLVGNLLYYLLLALAVQWAGVAPTALIIGMLPVLVALAGSREPGAVALGKLAWPLVLLLAGASASAVDTLQHAPAAAGAHGWPLRLAGMLCAVGALLAWGAYAVANTRQLARVPQLSSHEWSLLTGVVTGALALLLALPVFVASPAGAQGWGVFAAAMALLALGASLLGNGLWNAACRRLPLTLSGQLTVFEALFALLYGFLYDGRWPHPLEWLALFLLASGVAVSTWLHRPARPLAPGGAAAA